MAISCLSILLLNSVCLQLYTTRDLWARKWLKTNDAHGLFTVQLGHSLRGFLWCCQPSTSLPLVTSRTVKKSSLDEITNYKMTDFSNYIL